MTVPVAASAPTPVRSYACSCIQQCLENPHHTLIILSPYPTMSWGCRAVVQKGRGVAHPEVPGTQRTPSHPHAVLDGDEN